MGNLKTVEVNLIIIIIIIKKKKKVTLESGLQPDIATSVLNRAAGEEITDFEKFCNRTWKLHQWTGYHMAQTS
jgi:hypothetical protein